MKMSSRTPFARSRVPYRLGKPILSERIASFFQIGRIMKLPGTAPGSYCLRRQLCLSLRHHAFSSKEAPYKIAGASVSAGNLDLSQPGRCNPSHGLAAEWKNHQSPSGDLLYAIAFMSGRGGSVQFLYRLDIARCNGSKYWRAGYEFVRIERRIV